MTAIACNTRKCIPFGEKAGRAARSMDARVSFTGKLAAQPIVCDRRPFTCCWNTENGHGVRLRCPVPWESTI
jgi:hypothetical protein